MTRPKIAVFVLECASKSGDGLRVRSAGWLESGAPPW
jgi:hypothetical protein